MTAMGAGFAASVVCYRLGYAVVETRWRHVGRGRSLTCLAGFPATMVQSGTSFIATAAAPTIAPSPTVTPGPINARAQTHESALSTIGGVSSGMVSFV